VGGVRVPVARRSSGGRSKGNIGRSKGSGGRGRSSDG
jgi:hypothetical protein